MKNRAWFFSWLLNYHSNENEIYVKCNYINIRNYKIMFIHCMKSIATSDSTKTIFQEDLNHLLVSFQQTAPMHLILEDLKIFTVVPSNSGDLFSLSPIIKVQYHTSKC